MIPIDPALQASVNQLLDEYSDRMHKAALRLHDSVAQDLAALSMNLSLLERADPRAGSFQRLAGEARQILDTCGKQVRAISTSLYPPLLDQAGLEAALRIFLDQVFAAGQAALEVQAGFGRLDARLEQAIFCTATRLLSAARSPAGVRVILSRLPGSVELRLAADAPNAFGDPAVLDLARCRVLLLNGTIEVQPDPDKTTAVVRFPVLAGAETPEPEDAR